MIEVATHTDVVVDVALETVTTVTEVVNVVNVASTDIVAVMVDATPEIIEVGA